MLEDGQAKEEWVNLKREVKGSIRMELCIREVDKGGDSLINKGGTAKYTKARLGSLRLVRLAHR